MITPNQSDDTYCVIHNDKLYDLDLLDQYDFYDQCTPLEEWEDYPKQEDYQTMDDDEVVDDEEAYEEALDEFTQNVVYERLQTEMNELVEGYLEHVEEVAFWLPSHHYSSLQLFIGHFISHCTLFYNEQST